MADDRRAPTVTPDIAAPNCPAGAGRPEAYWRTPTKLRGMTRQAAQGQALDRGPLLTVARAGEYLGTGERFTRRLINERRISYIEVGKYVRLERSAPDALVDAGRVHSQH
ncbi:excisionase family DNA-binding protein [Geodermatophilus sp. SYSU D00710]